MRSFKKVAKYSWSIIIVMVNIILIIFIKNNYAYKLMNYNNFGMPALIKKGEVTDLWLGSSAFRQGIDIKVSYNGNQPVFEELQLKYLDKHHVKISRLYLDVYVYMMAKEPWISDDKLLLETDLTFKESMWDILCENNVVSGKEWYKVFVQANNEQLFTWPISNTLVNNRFYKGGNIANLKQKKAFENIILWAKEKKIEIVLIETPKWESVLQDNSYQELMRTVEDIAEQYNVKLFRIKGSMNEMEKNNIFYLKFPFDDEELFCDIVHLSSKGREKYTNTLLKKIEEISGR